MSGHSLEREARGYIRERRAIRRPQAAPDRGLRVGREEVVDFVLGLIVLALWFVALFYALPIIGTAVQ